MYNNTNIYIYTNTALYSNHAVCGFKVTDITHSETMAGEACGTTRLATCWENASPRANPGHAD